MMIKINENKLQILKLNTKNFYVLADFDNTITSKECKSSMGIITNSEMFGKEFAEEHSRICSQYKIKAVEAIDYDMKNEMWNKTLTGFFELFKKYNLNKEVLKNIVMNSNIRFREGFFDFLKFLYKNQIPVIIISAGVTNCIEIFLKNNGALFDNISIISNTIKFDDNGTIVEIPKFIINPANKNMIDFPNDIQKKIEKKEKVVLFGDTPGDIRMIENKDREKSLSIAFANKKEDIDELESNFDIVSEDSKILKMLEENIKNNS